jgi:hypothetical protein
MALQAEGVDISGCDFPLLHLLPLFRDGFDLYGGNRGPLAGDYKGYEVGDLPVSEAVHKQVLAFPGLTEPKPGVLEGYKEGFRKVTASAGRLLGEGT